MTIACAYVLMVLAVGHVTVGYAMYRDAIHALFRDGYFGAAAGHPDRLLAFWFILFSATLMLLGQLVLYSARTQDKTLLLILSLYIGLIGITGALALPRSPFLVAVIIAPVLFWQAAGNNPL
ncbi:MAG: hypothetical protein KJO31_11910 [Gammaproteobacteria bacterium]|nr:hypothetical protein [Gammaproteobacteria bacterium]